MRNNKVSLIREKNTTCVAVWFEKHNVIHHNLTSITFSETERNKEKKNTRKRKIKLLKLKSKKMDKKCDEIFIHFICDFPLV